MNVLVRPAGLSSAWLWLFAACVSPAPLLASPLAPRARIGPLRVPRPFVDTVLGAAPSPSGQVWCLSVLQTLSTASEAIKNYNAQKKRCTHRSWALLLLLFPVVYDAVSLKKSLLVWKCPVLVRPTGCCCLLAPGMQSWTPQWPVHHSGSFTSLFFCVKTWLEKSQGFILFPAGEFKLCFQS